MDAVIGSHPRSVRYYFRLIAGTFRTMLDVGMLVAGTGLIGLALAVLLDAFDLVGIGLGLSTGAMLGSALVIGVVGAFALGIASEGGYGAPESVRGYPILEVAVGRLVGVLAIGSLLLVGVSRLEPLVRGMPVTIRAAVEVLRATGAAGAAVVTVVGVPLALGLRRGMERVGWGEELELPLLYVVWALAALALFDFAF